MIDTATLEAPIISATTLMALASLLSALLAAYFLVARLRLKEFRSLGDSMFAMLLVLAIAIFVALCPFVSAGEDSKSLVFDNNTGSIQSIKGEKPISQVLEHSKTRIVSVPCVFVAGKKKKRHDCTFVNLGGGSFEVWDTATFRQTHPRS